ncbi:MAG: hypothetical protein ABI358_11995 [Ginsengibacter sp.]
MKKLLKNNFWMAGAIIGAITGYLYWNYIGCSSGKCVITSNPINSVVYFGIMGAMLLSIFQPEKIKSSEKIYGTL